MNPSTGASVPTNSKVAQVDSDFDLAVGQSVRIEGNALTITFNAVTADSRCPLGVFCIQAGNATLSLTVTDAAATKTLVLLYPNPTSQTPDSVKVAGYQISLVALQPIRRRDVTIPPESYIATLHVTHL